MDRLGYLLALLAAAVLFCIPAALLVPTDLNRGLRAFHPDLFDAVVGLLGAVVWGAVIWIYCAATARRLHDIDRSGWLAVLALIPAIGLGALTVYLLSVPGTDGANRHGARWL